MLERLRNHKDLILGASLVLVGGLLLLIAIPFVTGWLQYLSLAQAPRPPPKCGTTTGGAYCQVIIAWLVPPSPYLLLGALGVAIPVVFAEAWWIRRDLRTVPGAIAPHARWSRAANLLLMGTMAWVGLFIATGFALQWFSIPVFPWVRELFFASVLVAPAIVLGGGTVYLGIVIRHGLSARSRAARG